MRNGLAKIWIVLMVAMAAAGLSTDATAAQSEAALRAKVDRFVKDFVRSSGIKGAKYPSVTVKFVDLNSDGTAEALVIIKGAMFCGARGCSAFALDLRGAKARSLGDFTAATLSALPSKSSGWRHISLNGYRMTYRNGKYGR